MILDLYARLERRHWLDLVRLPVVLMLAFACFILGATAGQAGGMRFTETTGPRRHHRSCDGAGGPNDGA